MIGDLAGAAEHYTMPRLKLRSEPHELRTDDPIERWLNRYWLRIEQAYRVACSSDLPEPVVFACDLLDDAGRRVARACRGDREVEAILRDARAGRAQRSRSSRSRSSGWSNDSRGFGRSSHSGSCGSQWSADSTGWRAIAMMHSSSRSSPCQRPPRHDGLKWRRSSHGFLRRNRLHRPGSNDHPQGRCVAARSVGCQGRRKADRGRGLDQGRGVGACRRGRFRARYAGGLTVAITRWPTSGE